MPRVRVVDDITLNYEQAGEGSDLVLIHGLGGDLHVWDGDVPVFAGHHRVLRYDVRGFGASDKPLGQYALDVFASDLDALLTACGAGEAHVVGFSMGGVVAMKLALDYPTRIRSLVLVSTSSEVGPAATLAWQRLADRVEGEGFGPASVEATRIFSPAFLAGHPEVVADLDRRNAAIDRRVYVAVTRAVSQYNWTAELRRVTAPTLILQGLEDKLAPPGGAVKMKRVLPYARLLMVAETGHSLPVEQPTLFRNAVLAFTAGVDFERQRR